MQRDTHELLTAAQLAQEIQVGRRTIGAWTAARKIPCLRLGRRVLRYDLQRVRDALAKFEQEAVL
ncbi:MAG: helix-turn-helix transcriptional regulator [Bacteroidota bacterium]